MQKDTSEMPAASNIGSNLGPRAARKGLHMLPSATCIRNLNSCPPRPQLVTHRFCSVNTPPSRQYLSSKLPPSQAHSRSRSRLPSLHKFVSDLHGYAPGL